jgi:hypothetical protein
MHNGFMRVSHEPHPPTNEKPHSLLCGFFFFQ